MSELSELSRVEPRLAPIALCVNVDHVATLRQARRAAYPRPVEAARLAEDAGAAGITVHSVQRMTLEEIFVANVMNNRRERTV